MSQFIGTLSITLGFVFAGMFAQAAPKYPFILEVSGKVQWTDKDGKVAAPKPKQVLIEKAILQTEENSQVLIEIDAHRKLRLYGNSRLELPAISWETGEAPVLILKQGRLRWRQEKGKAYNIALRSDLFEFLTPTGDFIFEFEPKTAFAQVLVIEGTMEFSAMNAEDVALVTAGQKCSFQGVRESNEIVYDVLLKGRKIPRGKLGLVQAQAEAEKKLYSLTREKKDDETRKKKAQAEAKAHEKTIDPAAICQAPAAKLNQCAWQCENNPKKEKKICHLENPEVRCVRKRCNANGEWSESTEVGKEKAGVACSAEVIVKECDY